jgi:hypothetical protein
MKDHPAEEVGRHSVDARLHRTIRHEYRPVSSSSSITSSVPEDAFKRFDAKAIKFMRSKLSPVTSLKIVNSAFDTFRKKLQSFHITPVEIPDDLVTQEECEDIVAEVVGDQVTSLQLQCY